MFHGVSQTYLWAEFSQWANNLQPLKWRYRAQFPFPTILFHDRNIKLFMPTEYSY